MSEHRNASSKTPQCLFEENPNASPKYIRQILRRLTDKSPQIIKMHIVTL